MFVLKPGSEDLRFPPVELASPEGLLAVGGDLRAERLLEAYRHGIFPWYNPGQPILWWSPDPRAVLFPAKLRISRSLHKTLRRKKFSVTLDTAFREVIEACAEPRRQHPGGGTWITPEMIEAYVLLHERGFAHSVEVRSDGRLVGGLYGVALGSAYFGESMFSRASDASKVGFVHLVKQLERWGYGLIDCQLPSEHLFSLGAEQIRRRDFLARLEKALADPDRAGRWRLDPDLVVSWDDRAPDSVMTSHQKAPEIFLSMPHPCSYLPGRTATSLFLDPRCPLDSRQYAGFMRLGFRRSGDLIYRPHCRDCNACIPVRIPVERFRADRGQRRVWQRNRDLSVTPSAPAYRDEHFELYRRYQAMRHPGGGMDDPDPKKYISFLGTQHIDTVFYEIRSRTNLLGVAVTDVLPDGLSAVYTFFEPEERRRALGVYAVLWQIEQARVRRLPWLYLGYWIRECRKMAYKGNYHPLEVLQNGRWISVDDPQSWTG